jgi:PhoH-like ATPase
MGNHNKRIFVDTNILLNPKFNFNDYEKIYVSIITVQELDNLKRNERLGYQARTAIKNIEKANNVEIRLHSSFGGINFLENNNDNTILSSACDVYAYDKDCVFLTDDYALKVKADALELPCKMFEFDDNKDDDIYTGYKEISLSIEEQAEHYQNPTNKWGLLNNEYLIIKNSNGEVIDKQKWVDSKGFIPLSYKQIDNIYTGKIKPRNIYQELAFDLFQNNNITIKCIYGKYGSGKDLVMSAHALNLIQKGIYNKLIFVRNNYGVKNSKEIGYLPGSIDDKLLPFAMPLADHVGGVEGLKMLIEQRKVELQHFGFIRGRDIKNSIVYVSEAENMTKEHIQLLIGRLAEGSTLWINGDFKQVDDITFERNSGLKQLVNCLKGNELFGCVELNITERSKTAQLASLLD